MARYVLATIEAPRDPALHDTDPLSLVSFLQELATLANWDQVTSEQTQGHDEVRHWFRCLQQTTDRLQRSEQEDVKQGAHDEEALTANEPTSMFRFGAASLEEDEPSASTSALAPSTSKPTAKTRKLTAPSKPKPSAKMRATRRQTPEVKYALSSLIRPVQNSPLWTELLLIIVQFADMTTFRQLAQLCRQLRRFLETHLMRATRRLFSDVTQSTGTTAGGVPFQFQVTTRVLLERLLGSPRPSLGISREDRKALQFLDQWRLGQTQWLTASGATEIQRELQMQKTQYRLPEAPLTGSEALARLVWAWRWIPGIRNTNTGLWCDVHGCNHQVYLGRLAVSAVFAQLRKKTLNPTEKMVLETAPFHRAKTNPLFHWLIGSNVNLRAALVELAQVCSVEQSLVLPELMDNLESGAFYRQSLFTPEGIRNVGRMQHPPWDRVNTLWGVRPWSAPKIRALWPARPVSAPLPSQSGETYRSSVLLSAMEIMFILLGTTDDKWLQAAFQPQKGDRMQRPGTYPILRWLIDRGACAFRPLVSLSTFNKFFGLRVPRAHIRLFFQTLPALEALGGILRGIPDAVWHVTDSSRLREGETLASVRNTPERLHEYTLASQPDTAFFNVLSFVKHANVRALLWSRPDVVLQLLLPRKDELSRIWPTISFRGLPERYIVDRLNQAQDDFWLSVPNVQRLDAVLSTLVGVRFPTAFGFGPDVPLQWETLLLFLLVGERTHVEQAVAVSTQWEFEVWLGPIVQNTIRESKQLVAPTDLREVLLVLQQYPDRKALLDTALGSRVLPVLVRNRRARIVGLARGMYFSLFATEPLTVGRAYDDVNDDDSIAHFLSFFLLEDGAHDPGFLQVQARLAELLPAEGKEEREEKYEEGDDRAFMLETLPYDPPANEPERRRKWVLQLLSRLLMTSSTRSASRFLHDPQQRALLWEWFLESLDRDARKWSEWKERAPPAVPMLADDDGVITSDEHPYYSLDTALGKSPDMVFAWSMHKSWIRAASRGSITSIHQWVTFISRIGDSKYGFGSGHGYYYLHDVWSRLFDDDGQLFPLVTGRWSTQFSWPPFVCPERLLVPAHILIQLNLPVFTAQQYTDLASLYGVLVTDVWEQEQKRVAETGLPTGVSLQTLERAFFDRIRNDLTLRLLIPTDPVPAEPADIPLPAGAPPAAEEEGEGGDD